MTADLSGVHLLFNLGQPRWSAGEMVIQKIWIDAKKPKTNCDIKSNTMCLIVLDKLIKSCTFHSAAAQSENQAGLATKEGQTRERK